jgi:hypothetical protein
MHLTLNLSVVGEESGSPVHPPSPSVQWTGIAWLPAQLRGPASPLTLLLLHALLAAQEQSLGLGSAAATSHAELAAAATSAAAALEAAPRELECLQPAAAAGLGSPTACMEGVSSGGSSGGAFPAASWQLTPVLDQQVGLACFINKWKCTT